MLKCPVSYLIFKPVIICNVLFIGLRIKWFGLSFISSPNLAITTLFSLVAPKADSFYFPFLILPVCGPISGFPMPSNATYETYTHGQAIDFNFLQATECIFWISLLFFALILNIAS